MPATTELARLGVDDVIELNEAVRTVAVGASSMAGAAQAIAQLLHDRLRTADGGPACALVRLYATSRHAALPPVLQAFAGPVPGTTGCLTLLGTAGVERAWCDRRTSRAHQAIALTSAEAIAEAPMVAGLLAQLGIDAHEVVELNQRGALTMHHREYGIFHVGDAAGSDLIPAKGFVRSAGVRSVIGCGGAFPSGEVFTLIAFSTVDVERDRAELLRTLAYGIKAALIPYTFNLFDG